MKRVSIILILLLFSGVVLVTAGEPLFKLYRQAVILEKEGRIDRALTIYQKVIEQTADKRLRETLILKTARLQNDYQKSVSIYEEFLENYSGSRLRFIARFELAQIHRLAGEQDAAIREFYILSRLAQGTPYWQKSLLNVVEIEIEMSMHARAINNLHKLLKADIDYEDTGTVYYLLGMALLSQGMYTDAEYYFLLCAGSYPQSSRAAASLLAMVQTYVAVGRISAARRIVTMIKQLYADAPENYEATRLMKKAGSESDNDQHPEIELINVNDDIEIKSRSLAFIEEQLQKSYNDLPDVSDDSVVSDETLTGFYLQLGYYSTKKYALLFIESLKAKNIKSAFTAKTRSASSDKIFWRVVVGPFTDREKTNQMLIALKEKNVESIILELIKEYE